ncbi:MAG: DUF3568 family protein [Gemmatimonadota bacterium]
MHQTVRRTLVLGLVPFSAVASGCLLAAGAAAGSGVYFTTRGAGAIVQGNVGEVTGSTAAAFENLGIEARGRKDTDDAREIYGVSGDDDVTVELKKETDRATRVEVRVRKSSVTWDKDFARKILDEIDRLRSG